MKYIDLLQQFEELTGQVKPPKLVVAVYGLMNSGKSTLLNMLTKNVEHEFFKTADIRETVDNRSLEYEDIVYLDTPGLDANEQDDLKARLGEEQADIVLFVHQPQGELDAREVQFLRDLAVSFGDFASQNILLVLSKIDKASAHEIELISESMNAQCQEALGFIPKTIFVSSKRYETGVRNDKAPLRVQSHIDELRLELQRYSAKAAQTRSHRMQIKAAALLEEIVARELALKNRQAFLHNGLASGFAGFNAQVSNLREFLDTSAANFKRI